MHTLLVCSPDNHLACTQMWLCLIRTEIIVLTLFSNILTYYIQINLTNQKKNELGILENDGSCGNSFASSEYPYENTESHYTAKSKNPGQHLTKMGDKMLCKAPEYQ